MLDQIEGRGNFGERFAPSSSGNTTPNPFSHKASAEIKQSGLGFEENQ
jgi:hypothetical protein